MRKLSLLICTVMALLTITTQAQGDSSLLVGVRDGVLWQVNLDTGEDIILNDAEEGVEFYPFDSNSRRDVLVLAYRFGGDSEIRLYDGESGAMRTLTGDFVADCPPHFVGDTQVAYVSGEIIDTYQGEGGADLPANIHPVVLHDIETNSITHIQDIRITIGGGGGGGSSYAMSMVVDMDYYSPDTYIGSPRFFRVLEDNSVLAGGFRCLGGVQRISEDAIQSLDVSSWVSVSDSGERLASLDRFTVPPSLTTLDLINSRGTTYPLADLGESINFFTVHWARDDNVYFSGSQRATPAYTLTQEEQDQLDANDFTRWDWTGSNDVSVFGLDANDTPGVVVTFDNAFEITRIDSDPSYLYVAVVPDGTPVIEALRADELDVNSNDELYSYLYPNIYRIPFGTNQAEFVYPRLQRFIVVE